MGTPNTTLANHHAGVGTAWLDGGTLLSCNVRTRKRSRCAKHGTKHAHQQTAILSSTPGPVLAQAWFCVGTCGSQIETQSERQVAHQQKANVHPRSEKACYPFRLQFFKPKTGHVYHCFLARLLRVPLNTHATSRLEHQKYRAHFTDMGTSQTLNKLNYCPPRSYAGNAGCNTIHTQYLAEELDTRPKCSM